MAESGPRVAARSTVPTVLPSALEWPPLNAAANASFGPSRSRGCLVVNDTTPPSASLPHSAETGPRAISARRRLSMSTKSLRALKNGPKENSSGTRTPSMSVNTRLPPMPRIRKPASPKRLPVPATPTPGSKRTRSAMSRTSSSSICSAVFTETVAATASSGRSVRVATTVIVSSAVSASSSATLPASAKATPAMSSHAAPASGKRRATKGFVSMCDGSICDVAAKSNENENDCQMHYLFLSVPLQAWCSSILGRRCAVG